MPAPKGKKVPARANQGTVNPERLAVVERLLLSCAPHPAIERQLSAPPRIVDGKNVGGFGVTPRTIRYYIARVEAEWAKRKASDFDVRRKQMRYCLEGILQRALSLNDMKSAVAAADRLCKLDGLYMPEVSVGVGLDGSSSDALARTQPDSLRDRVRTLLLAPSVKQSIGTMTLRRGIVQPRPVPSAQPSSPVPEPAGGEES